MELFLRTAIYAGLIVVGLVALLIFIYNIVNSPLKSFPGPFANKFTNIRRFLSRDKLISLTRIYNAGNLWKRQADKFSFSRMYRVGESTGDDGQPFPNFFSTSDGHWHATVLRPIGAFFSASNVLGLEGYVDDTIDLFIRMLEERFVDKGLYCDMAEYVLFFAWDVTFGEPIGFLEAGRGCRRLLKMADWNFDYFAAASPELDMLLDKNPVYKLSPPSLGWAAQISVENYKRRQMGNRRRLPTGRSDMLYKYLDAQRKHPELVDDNIVISYLVNNTVAGSNPTAYTLTTVIYYVLKDPLVHMTLREETENARLTVPVSWKAAQQLPYLDAIIREAICIHPGVSLILERVVPARGLTLPDDVFGADPDLFIPESWLKGREETELQFQVRRRWMISTHFSFGAGSRACLGKHLSIMEMYKLAIKLVHPNEEWKVTNSFVLRTENVPVILRSKSQKTSYHQ
ncbi:hypothetical protein VTN77DRAFT_1367 [Rasamsonia byssochlamydoides]|uniref:uncharacterized protein n=1 Tax=Rasamsonia byssochlamydoides TaxID=89139 RepID=UPI003744325C